MKKWWVTLSNGEYGYLWADTKPLFASFVTIMCETWDGEYYTAYGQVYKVEQPKGPSGPFLLPEEKHMCINTSIIPLRSIKHGHSKLG